VALPTATQALPNSSTKRLIASLCSALIASP
jgi:hypothetical protein